MKIILLLLIFLFSSSSLIYLTIKRNAPTLYADYLQKIDEAKAEIISSKAYKKNRKTYTPKRSASLGDRKIQELLAQQPFHFEQNNTSLSLNKTLKKVVNVVNNINERVVLNIETHTNATGSEQHNVALSQKQADALKSYFKQKTHLPFIVAIGYGEAFSFKNKIVKINLKRIQ